MLLRIQSVCAVSLASCWHRWTIVRRRFSSTRSVFPSPRVCEKLPAWFEPTAEIKNDLRCIAIRWALPFGGFENGAPVHSPLYACAQHSLSGGSRPTAATAKEDREKQSEEGGVCSGGTPYRGVKRRSRWRFFQWLVAMAVMYGR